MKKQKRIKMKKTIAIVGAGPGVGFAVAEKFGIEGYNVALLARNVEKLNALKDDLLKKGIEAATFQADILDRGQLTRALQEVIHHYGAIDILEFSPTPTWESMRTARNIDIANEQYHLDYQVLAAITAVQVVLPQMLERKDGSVLFTTASSAQHPVNRTASFGVAAGALLNYARLLNMDLKEDSIFAGIVSIGALVVSEGKHKGDFQDGMPTITAAEVAEAHWNLYNQRNVAEIMLP
ncbi:MULTISPECIES: SDR family NAD(P)-dependent oxidoreductase [Mucilaginibacter]|jgi:NADP-dependent 3-hydroxy acid dehydrogenase YdfG|uniref:SDR family NAD(P)-dependent oxidoreductase n=1 Tax=Mucilaginibacter TaxID=423349 RepID=UPI0016689B05|nr:SDR family NAD(P)-dependent oxidoreductase [Mucilaginibacter rubeus]GGB16115.1 oxidoreductase [Mucilaginibacter rubeus]